MLICIYNSELTENIVHMDIKKRYLRFSKITLYLNIHYIMMIIVQNKSLIYNSGRIVRRGWASLRYEGRGVYEWL